MLTAPSAPDLPEEQCTTGKGYLRYEDVCQDGRIQLQGLPHSIGMVVWRKLLATHPIVRLRSEQGVIPIISRMITSGTSGTVRVGETLAARGCFDLGHSRDQRGDVQHLLMYMWVDLDSPRGERAGSVYVEHIFTRMFAPKGERKVTRFHHGELPAVPERQYSWSPPHSTLELPEGAAWIDHCFELDPALVAFGLNHTDSNQHVNSLVYPRMFEEATLRRFAALGRPTRLLARYSEMAYRKPCFAGERARIVVRAFELGGKLGAVAALVTEDVTGGDTAAVIATRPYCFGRLLFEE